MPLLAIAPILSAENSAENTVQPALEQSSESYDLGTRRGDDHRALLSPIV